jgi:hypothetical protein
MLVLPKTEYLKRNSIKSEFQQEMLIGSLRENLADFAVMREQQIAITTAEIASCSRVHEEWFLCLPWAVRN